MSNKQYYRDKKTWILTRNTAIGFFVMGLMILTLHFTSLQPLYENMLHDVITIQSVHYVATTHGTGHYELKSTQGLWYIIWMQDVVHDLDEKTSQGTQVEILYYTTTFPRYHHISEMTDAETEWVVYHDYRASDSIGCAVFTSVLGLFGTVFLVVGISNRKKSYYTKEKTKELEERARTGKTNH